MIDVHSARMREYLVQCRGAVEPLFPCLTPPIDSSEAANIVSLFPPDRAPDAITLKAELEVLTELCGPDASHLEDIRKVSETNKDVLP